MWMLRMFHFSTTQNTCERCRKWFCIVNISSTLFNIVIEFVLLFMNTPVVGDEDVVVWLAHWHYSKLVLNMLMLRSSKAAPGPWSSICSMSDSSWGWWPWGWCPWGAGPPSPPPPPCHDHMPERIQYVIKCGR